MKEVNDKDKEILSLLTSSPEAGFRLLFESYHMRLCVYAVQITDSFSVAEDIVQDFFVHFWDKRYFLSVKDNLRSYMFTAVHNACLSYMKQKKVVPMDDAVVLNLEATINCNYELEELREAERKLNERLKLLPPQQLHAIQELIVKNRKYNDVAGELNISVNTLKTHLTRGLKKLREEYNLNMFVPFL
ncbi:MAG: RNA polymerase sigma-70 factor [Marinifilaceae bacterium]